MQPPPKTIAFCASLRSSIPGHTEEALCHIFFKESLIISTSFIFSSIIKFNSAYLHHYHSEITLLLTNQHGWWTPRLTVLFIFSNSHNVQISRRRNQQYTGYFWTVFFGYKKTEDVKTTILPFTGPILSTIDFFFIGGGRSNGTLSGWNIILK